MDDNTVIDFSPQELKECEYWISVKNSKMQIAQECLDFASDMPKKATQFFELIME